MEHNEQVYPKIKGSWYKSPGTKRPYHTINNYKVVKNGISNHSTDIDNKMKTKKTSQCQG